MTAATTDPGSDSEQASTTADPHALAHRIVGCLRGEDRFILGIVGAPGAGKSRLVARLTQALAPRPVVVVPMDGFHLGNAILAGTDLASRKGAIDTVDAAGFAVLLQRLHRRNEPVVYAPSYVRDIEEPIAASIAVPSHVQIVITEGNYLLAPGPEWTAARAAIDQVWYLDLPDRERRERLLRRHIAFGKAPAAAQDWVNGSDEANARLIAITRRQADLILRAQ